METLKDYFDWSLFNQAISRPLEYDGLLEKEEATKGIDTYSTDGHSQVSETNDGILVEGEKTQYWLGRNTRIDENMRDCYNYKVKVVRLDDSICVEVEADIDRFVGSSYWEDKKLLTDHISTIPKENGIYHIAFEEFYSLKDDVLVHETTLSDKVEVFLVPEDFKLSDSFKDSERYVFEHAVMQDEVKKLKELPQDKLDA